MARFSNIGAGILGGTALGGSGGNAAAAEFSGPQNLYSQYRLELINGTTENRIAVLLHATNISVSERLNEPGALDFDLSADAWYIDQVAPPNYVALYDSTGALKQNYEIVTDQISLGDESLRSIACLDPLYLLRDDSIAYQNWESDPQFERLPRTMSQTVADLLNAQTNTRKVRLGTIDAVIASKQFRIGNEDDYQSPLALLQELRDVVGGFFYIDSDRRLNWHQSANAGRDAREIRWRKNLLGFREDIDHDGVITHLRYLGWKFGVNEQLALPSPGYIVSPSYEEGDRQRWHTIVDQDIKFESTLVKAAELFHARHQRADIRATVNILDLSYSPEYNYDEWYRVQVGDLVKIYHPKLGSDALSVTVVARNVDLSDPLNVSLELATLHADVALLIKDLIERQRRLESRRSSGGEVAEFEDDPEVFQPPGTPDSASSGDSDRAIRSDAVLPILPPLDTYVPPEILVGPGSPGIGPYAAPQDHTHPLDPLDVIDDFEGAGFVTYTSLPEDLAEILTGDTSPELEAALDAEIEEFATDIEPLPIVADAAAVGTETEYARADHEHLGMPWISVNAFADLPEDQPDGVIGYTSDEDEEASYLQINGAWVQIVVNLGTVTTLPAIPTAYEAVCRFAGQRWHAGPGDTYWTPGQRQTSVSGTPGTEFP